MEHGAWGLDKWLITPQSLTHLEETRPGALAPSGNVALWIFVGTHD